MITRQTLVATSTGRPDLLLSRVLALLPVWRTLDTVSAAVVLFSQQNQQVARIADILPYKAKVTKINTITLSYEFVASWTHRKN